MRAHHHTTAAKAEHRVIQRYRAHLLCMSMALISLHAATAQNLVQNPDFEQFSSCPSSFAQLQLALPWINPTPGGSPNGSSDYFNDCAVSPTADVPVNFAGTQAAHSGSGYAGLATFSTTVPEFREYIEVELDAPLTAGVCYELAFHVSRGDTVRYGTCDLGALFSDTLIMQNTPGPIPIAPSFDNMGGCLSDAQDWTLLSGLYEAHGGESYLLIGNFHSDANTTLVTATPGALFANAYYYIDDVSVVVAHGGAGCASTSVGDRSQHRASFWPDPVQDVLFVDSGLDEPTSLVMRDARGSVVMTTRFTRSLSVPVGHLTAGLYLYEVAPRVGVAERGVLIKE